MQSVWVVDDDEDYRELVSLALREHCGISSVQSFGDGASALAALNRPEEASPLLVLLDLHMPQGSGLQVLRALRQRRPGLAVAILSGAATEAELQACLAALPLAFLHKPLTQLDLGRALQRLIDSLRAPTLPPVPAA